MWLRQTFGPTSFVCSEILEHVPTQARLGVPRSAAAWRKRLQHLVEIKVVVWEGGRYRVPGGPQPKETTGQTRRQMPGTERPSSAAWAAAYRIYLKWLDQERARRMAAGLPPDRPRPRPFRRHRRPGFRHGRVIRGRVHAKMPWE